MKKNSRNTKGKIVSAAWKLFYEQGYDNTTVEEIKAGAVVAHTVLKRRDRATKQMVTVKDEVFEVAADTIVYATGMAQNDSSAIVAACEELGIPCEAIGSAKKLGHGVPAILDGAIIGRKI